MNSSLLANIVSEEQLCSMERVARDNARPILRMLITEGGADLTVRDRAGVDVLCRAATVAGRVEKNNE